MNLTYHIAKAAHARLAIDMVVVVEAAPTAGVGALIVLAVGALTTVTPVTASAKFVLPSLVAWALSFAWNPPVPDAFRNVFSEVAPDEAAFAVPALT